jgi:repressor LexA
VHRLTRRQRSILEFVVAKIDDRGIPPSLQEIAREFGLRSPAGIVDHLKAIERKGYIRRRPGISRGIEVLRRPRGVSAAPIAVRVPLAGELPGRWADFGRGSARDHLVLDRRLAAAGSFALRVRSTDYASHDVDRGDLVVVTPGAVPPPGGLALVRGGETTTLARMRSGRSLALLTPLASADEIDLVGRVATVIRSMTH